MWTELPRSVSKTENRVTSRPPSHYRWLRSVERDMGSSLRSVEGYVGLLDHLGVLGRVAGDLLGEDLRGRRPGSQALGGKFLLHGWRGSGLGDLVVETLDHRSRGGGWRAETEPGSHFETGVTQFGDGRHFRQQRRAFA